MYLPTDITTCMGLNFLTSEVICIVFLITNPRSSVHGICALVGDVTVGIHPLWECC